MIKKKIHESNRSWEKRKCKELNYLGLDYGWRSIYQRRNDWYSIYSVSRTSNVYFWIMTHTRFSTTCFLRPIESRIKRKLFCSYLSLVVCTHSVPKVKSPLYWITDYRVSLNHQDKKSYSHHLFRLYRSCIYFRCVGIIDVSSSCTKSGEFTFFFVSRKSIRVKDENINEECCWKLNYERLIENL